MNEGIRTTLGFLVAPLLPGVLFGALDSFAPSPVGLLWYLKFSGMAGYPAALLLGLPIHLLYRRYRLVSLVAYAGTGAVLGAIVYVGALLPGVAFSDSSAVDALRATIRLLPLDALCGAMSAGVFWLIARPDRGSDKPVSTSD